MKHFKKKSVVRIVCAALAVLALLAAAIIFMNSADSTGGLSATVVDVAAKRQQMEQNILPWDSSEQEHIPSAANVKCAITVGNVTTEFHSFQEGWVAATTTYKNTGDLEFIFYDDWVADENGVFGTDEGTSFVNGSGGLLIKNWKNDITLNFNGYKLDRNLKKQSVSSGSVIKVDEGKEVFFKNGCITGGATDEDGGGVLIYGKPMVYFENMTITGNFSGQRGGGIFIGTHAGPVCLDNTAIEGNYSEKYGGGIHSDFTSGTGHAKLQLSNVVTVRNNIGADYRNNLTLGCSSNQTCSYISDIAVTEGSEIYLSLTRRDSTARGVIEDKDGYEDDCDRYFHADDPSCTLLATQMGGESILGLGGWSYPGMILFKK